MVDQGDKGRQLEERDGATVDQSAAEKAAGAPKGDADELVGLGGRRADGRRDRLPARRGQPLVPVRVELCAELAQRQPVWYLCRQKLVGRRGSGRGRSSGRGDLSGVGDVCPAVVVLDGHSSARKRLLLAS